MQLCSGLRSIERLIFSLYSFLLHNIIYKVGEEAAVRVEELVSKLQEYRRKEEEEYRKKKEEEEKGKTDVIGAIMAAIGEMPDTQTGERPTLDLVGKDLEKVDDRMDVAQVPIEVLDAEVVCIEEDVDNNSTDKSSHNASEGSGNINIVSEEEVLSLEEVEVTNLEEELTKMEEEVNHKVEEEVNNKKREVVTVEEEVDGKKKEVDNMEELSFTAALEELGGLLDLCPT